MVNSEARGSWEDEQVGEIIGKSLGNHWKFREIMGNYGKLLAKNMQEPNEARRPLRSF